jgi:hypothetical protein
MIQKVLLKKIRAEFAKGLKTDIEKIKKIHFDINEHEELFKMAVNDSQFNTFPLSDHISQFEVFINVLKNKFKWEKLYKIDFICHYEKEIKIEINIFCLINGNKEKITTDSLF